MLIVKLGREQGIDPDKLWNLGIVAILSGVVGSKVLMMLVDFGYYSEHPGEIFALSTLQAGGVWSGGLVLALLMCVWYMRRNEMPVWRAATCLLRVWRWDTPSAAWAVSPPAAATDARRMCPGRSPSATRWPRRSSVRHWAFRCIPRRFTSSCWRCFNCIFLVWLIRRKKFEGEIIGAYLMIYGVGRYFIEFFRGDPGRGSYSAS